MIPQIVIERLNAVPVRVMLCFSNNSERVFQMELRYWDAEEKHWALADLCENELSAILRMIASYHNYVLTEK